MPGNEARIRQRAYDIWMREGQPDSRREAHWRQACEDVEAEGAQPQPLASAPDEAPAPVPPEDEACSALGAAAAAAVSGARKA